MRRRSSTVAIVCLVLAPAALVAAAVWLWSSEPLRVALADTRRQQAEVAREQPTARHLADAQARVAALRAQLATAAAAQPLPEPAANRVVPATERAEWRAQVTSALVARRLDLVDEERTEIDLPPVVARAFAVADATRLPAWSLRLSGAYLDVLGAIDDLQRGLLPCHVFELRMRRDAAGALEWTLVVG